MKKTMKKLVIGKLTLRKLGTQLSRVRGGFEKDGDGSIFETIVGKPPPYTEGTGCTVFCPTRD